MLLSLIRYILGYVQFQIVGSYPERFINIVTKNRVSIWDTCTDSSSLTACMFVRDYLRVRHLAKKSSVRLRCIKRCGLPFVIKNHRNRVGVLLGVCLFIAITLFMSSFVWTIEVTGLETLSYSQLMQTLRKNGLYIGTFKPTTSFTEVSRNTMLELDSIGWMAINVLGSNASVEIKEKAIAQKTEYSQPCNVKAERDGLILSIDTKKGDAYFSSGSGVLKDQLLVSAVVEDELGGLSLVRADAVIMAQTHRKARFEVPKNQTLTRYPSTPTLSRNLNVFNLSLPLTHTFSDTDDVLRYHNSGFVLFDTALPLSISEISVFTPSYTNEKLDESLMKSQLMTQQMLFRIFALSECEVTDHSFRYSYTDKSMILDADYTCTEDIAYQQDIDVSALELLENEQKSLDEQ